MKRLAIPITVFIVCALAFSVMLSWTLPKLHAQGSGYQTKVYTQQGGDSLEVVSGGQATVRTGGVLDIRGTWKIGGTAVTGTAASISGITPVHIITTDSTLTAAQMVGGTWVALPLAAKKTVTLPACAAGLNGTFMAADSDSIRITITAGDSLITTTGAAYVTTTTVAGNVRIVAIDATRWFMLGAIGTWTSY